MYNMELYTICPEDAIKMLGAKVCSCLIKNCKPREPQLKPLQYCNLSRNSFCRNHFKNTMESWNAYRKENYKPQCCKAPNAEIKWLSNMLTGKMQVNAYQQFQRLSHYSEGLNDDSCQVDIRYFFTFNCKLYT